MIVLSSHFYFVIHLRLSSNFNAFTAAYFKLSIRGLKRYFICRLSTFSAAIVAVIKSYILHKPSVHSGAFHLMCSSFVTGALSCCLSCSTINSFHWHSFDGRLRIRSPWQMQRFSSPRCSSFMLAASPHRPLSARRSLYPFSFEPSSTFLRLPKFFFLLSPSITAFNWS